MRETTKAVLYQMIEESESLADFLNQIDAFKIIAKEIFEDEENLFYFQILRKP